jgi:hypothetical protein
MEIVTQAALVRSLCWLDETSRHSFEKRLASNSSSSSSSWHATEGSGKQHGHHLYGSCANAAFAAASECLGVLEHYESRGVEGTDMYTLAKTAHVLGRVLPRVKRAKKASNNPCLGLTVGDNPSTPVTHTLHNRAVLGLLNVISHGAINGQQSVERGMTSVPQASGFIAGTRWAMSECMKALVALVQVQGSEWEMEQLLHLEMRPTTAPTAPATAVVTGGVPEGVREGDAAFRAHIPGTRQRIVPRGVLEGVREGDAAFRAHIPGTRQRTGLPRDSLGVRVYPFGGNCCNSNTRARSADNDDCCNLSGINTCRCSKFVGAAMLTTTGQPLYVEHVKESKPDSKLGGAYNNNNNSNNKTNNNNHNYNYNNNNNNSKNHNNTNDNNNRINKTNNKTNHKPKVSPRSRVLGVVFAQGEDSIAAHWNCPKTANILSPGNTETSNKQLQQQQQHQHQLREQDQDQAYERNRDDAQVLTNEPQKRQQLPQQKSVTISVWLRTTCASNNHSHLPGSRRMADSRSSVSLST